MRGLAIICLVFTVFLFCGFNTSLAAVDNIKISGDITSQAIARDLSFGLGVVRALPLGTTDETKDLENFLILQTRLRFDADLTEDVETAVGLLDERVWGLEQTEGNAGNTDVDLDIAYLKIKDFLDYPVTITIGRQPLRFGNAFIVGDPDTDVDTSSASGLYHVADDLSLRKSFDAIRATFDFNPLVLDLIYAVVAEGSTNLNDDVQLYGFNANYSPDEKSTYELYLFAKDKDYDSYTTSILGTTLLQDEENYILCLGTHAKKDLTDNLTVDFEVAHQFGDFRDASGLHAKRDAWGAQIGLDYKFLDKAYSILGFWYTYLSGDGDDSLTAGGSAGSLYTAWDPMFEDQQGGEIINLILPQTNSHTITLYYFRYLHEKINALIMYNHYRTVKNHYSTRYGIATGPAYGNNYYVSGPSKHLGDEVDVKLTYDYSENTQFMLVGAVAFPGGLLASENDNTAYVLRSSVKVSF